MEKREEKSKVETVTLQSRLEAKIKREHIITDCDMSQFTSFRAGGKASLLVLPTCKEDLIFALRECAQSGIPYMVMGNGSNILVRDDGYKGAIIKLGESFSSISVEGNRLIAGGGALMSSVAKAALEAELTGFEFASGIPGSLGGAVFMNAGAYDGEMKQIVKEAEVISKDGSRVSTLACSQLGLAYRHSVFHDTEDVIVSVTLQLKTGNKADIQATMKELMKRRNSKQPVHLPSAGSFFKRPQGYFAGKLIQDAGLKGLRAGDAQVSELHSGFIVNTGNATATDITQLMEIVQAAVLDQFGVKLEPEVRIIGE